jgi:hypothetical protein
MIGHWDFSVPEVNIHANPNVNEEVVGQGNPGDLFDGDAATDDYPGWVYGSIPAAESGNAVQGWVVEAYLHRR